MRFFLKKENGSITVFLVLILVPSIFFVGFLDDLARMKFYNNQAVMAADNYSQAILSEYDNLLKDLYGFFAITQNEEARAALDSLQEYMGSSFNPSTASINYDYDSLNLILGEKTYEGFMPYSNANFSFSKDFMPGSTLDNNDVFATQLGDFMRFRIIQQFIDSDGNYEDNLSELVSAVKATSADDAVSAAKADLQEPLGDFITAVEEYYKALAMMETYNTRCLNGCAASIDITGFGEGMTKSAIDMYKEIINSQDYKDYLVLKYEDKIEWDNQVITLETIEAIDEAVQADKEEALKEDIILDNEDTPTFNALSSEDEIRLIREYWDLDNFVYSIDNKFAVAYMWFTLHCDLESDGESFKNNYKLGDNNTINMGTFDEGLDTLIEKAEKINDTLDAVNEKIEALREAVSANDVSQAVKSTEEETIKNAEKLIDMAKVLYDIPNAMEQHGVRTQNDVYEIEILTSSQQLRTAWSLYMMGEEYDLSSISPIDYQNIGDKTATITGTNVTWYSYWISGDPFWDFRSDETYNQAWADLDYYFSNGGDDNLKKEADKKQDDAEEKTKDAEKDLNEDQETKARDIPSDLGFTSEGNLSYAFKDIGKLIGNISGGNWANEGNRRLLQLYAIEYDFGMFSSRVTNVNSNSSNGTTSSNSAPALSLTGYEMARNINYLYGAELEYLIAGNNSSQANLNTTRDAIVAFRMLMNFTSTYTISDLNQIIVEIAQPFNAIPYVGPAVAIAVDIALRVAVSTAETVCDWKALIKGEKVVLYKTEMKDLQCIDTIAGLLGNDDKLYDKTSSDSDEKIELGYEDYLLIMMIFFVPPDALFDRTQNLVELNVNTVAQGIGSDGTLSSLTFKMSEAYTAVTTTCTIDSGFVFMPDGFAQMLLGADSDTYTALKKFEENKYGYSVIRGY